MNNETVTIDAAITRLVEIRKDVEEVIAELTFRNPPPPKDKGSRTTRILQLLSAIADEGGTITYATWLTLARQAGYPARSAGGLFQNSGIDMNPDRSVSLNDYGRQRIERGY
jgi:hypothetical protein